MKYKILAAFLLLHAAVWMSCKKDAPSQPSAKEENKEEPGTASFNLKGQYIWDFEIPNIGAQRSQLFFYKDSIGYAMNGPAYTTDYVMMLEDYTDKNGERRWIGTGRGGSISKDGVWFVLFFKDITDQSVSVYKRECKDGRSEAETYPYPSEHATEDHGWNKYIKQ